MNRLMLLVVTSLFLGVGDGVPALAATSVGRQTTGNVQLVPDANTGPVAPTDPDGSGKPFPGDPDDPDNPGTGSRGHLTLDYLSNLTFQQQAIQDGTITATVANTQPFIQLSDRRGSGTGWSLMLKPEPLVGQTNGAQLKALTVSLGETRFLSAGENASRQPDVLVTATQALPVGSYSLVARAQNTPGDRQGVGTWLWRLNTSSTQPMRLSILESAVTREQTYQGTLSWLLTDTPQ